MDVINANNVLITIKNLNKTYVKKQNTKIIFNDFSLKIYENEKLAILGKNGVGKTTLISIIIGKIKNYTGEVQISDKIKDFLLDVGYLPQEFKFPSFFKIKSIYKLIIADLKTNGLYDEQYINKIIKILDITELMSKYYKNLSGGEKQKVNFLITLLYQPKVFILDEFTSNIDLETSLQIRNLLKNMANNTVILVSHNIREVCEIATRVIFLKNGKLQKEITGSEINEETIKQVFDSY